MTQPKNPFIIPVPEGVTEIDLSSLMLPLIHAIRAEIVRHEHTAHRWGSDDRTTHLEPDCINEWFYQAQIELRFEETLRRMTRPSLVACLEDNGWKELFPGSGEFMQDYHTEAFSYNGPRILLGTPDRYNLHNVRDAVMRLSATQGISRLDAAELAASYESVLDRIAQETK
ncbi:MAG: hypothetical protein AB7L09_02955 [Nitrospira sp.]